MDAIQSRIVNRLRHGRRGDNLPPCPIRRRRDDPEIRLQQGPVESGRLALRVKSESGLEAHTGRLRAVASTDMALVPLWQAYTQQGKIMALLYGRSTEAGPLVVA